MPPKRHQARLIRARKAAGLTQQKLADLIGVPQSSIARFESGRYDPSLRNALKIARVLGDSVEEIFGGVLENEAPAPR